jgi:hypothetical protein
MIHTFLTSLQFVLDSSYALELLRRMRAVHFIFTPACIRPHVVKGRIISKQDALTAGTAMHRYLWKRCGRLCPARQPRQPRGTWLVTCWKSRLLLVTRTAFGQLQGNFQQVTDHVAQADRAIQRQKPKHIGSNKSQRRTSNLVPLATGKSGSPLSDVYL